MSLRQPNPEVDAAASGEQENYKPITFTQYVWERCKSQPLIPIGCVATVGALVGASVAMRTGNRNNFNWWLRMRVLAQGATVVAMVAYGSVALTREQQQKHYIKSQVILGDLPPNTQWPGRKEGESPPQFEGGYDKVALEAAARAEAERADAMNYPLSKKDRITRDEFQQRLREAEKQHEEEQAHKKARAERRAAQ